MCTALPGCLPQAADHLLHFFAASAEMGLRSDAAKKLVGEETRWGQEGDGLV